MQMFKMLNIDYKALWKRKLNANSNYENDLM